MERSAMEKSAERTKAVDEGSKRRSRKGKSAIEAHRSKSAMPA